MSDNVNRFLGDTPGRTFVRLAVISLVVGIIMSAVGLTPMEIWYSVERFIWRLYDLGFDAVWRIVRYFVWGAVIVLPIFLLTRLFKSSR